MGRKKTHTPEEIVAKLRQVEVLTAQGKAVAEAVRSIGVTEQTFLPLARGVRRAEARPGEAAEAAGSGERAAAQGGVGPDAGEGHPEGGRVGKLLLYSGRMTQLLIGCCRPRRMKGPAELSLLSGVGAVAAAMLGSERMGGTI
jgi:hypothetical protein